MESTSSHLPLTPPRKSVCAWNYWTIRQAIYRSTLSVIECRWKIKAVLSYSTSSFEAMSPYRWKTSCCVVVDLKVCDKYRHLYLYYFLSPVGCWVLDVGCWCWLTVVSVVSSYLLLVVCCRVLTAVDCWESLSVVVSGYWLSVVGLLVVDFLC